MREEDWELDGEGEYSRKRIREVTDENGDVDERVSIHALTAYHSVIEVRFEFLLDIFRRST